MNKTIFLLVIIVSSCGCKKDKPYCGCGKEDPIKNIEWLNSFVKYYNNDTSHKWSEINLYMYDYKKSNAFIFETKEVGLYDVPTSIYDCSGKTIFICGGLQPPQLDSCNIFFQSASNRTLIWSKR
jgi:hypothetical protein